MSWFRSIFAKAILVAILFMLAAFPAAAQRGRAGGGRVSPGIGARSYGAIGGYGLSRYSHGFYHNGNYYRAYPFYNGYPFFLGLSPYGYLPYAFGYGGSPFPDGYIPPAAGPEYPPGPPEIPAETLAQVAKIDVILPTESANLFVEGRKTSSTGTRRSFLSPVLTPGTYTYRVTASWGQPGQEVRVERTIQVMPGNRYLVDFTRIDATPRMPPAD